MFTLCACVGPNKSIFPVSFLLLVCLLTLFRLYIAHCMCVCVGEKQLRLVVTLDVDICRLGVNMRMPRLRTPLTHTFPSSLSLTHTTLSRLMVTFCDRSLFIDCFAPIAAKPTTFRQCQQQNNRQHQQNPKKKKKQRKQLKKKAAEWTERSKQ